MKKLLLIALAIGSALVGMAFAFPAMADVLQHIGTGLSMLGMVGTVAQSSNATSTTFLTAASPNDITKAIATNITETGNQDVTQFTPPTGFTQAGTIIKYQTAITPFAVPATTCAQNTSSVSTTLQLGYQFATNSVYVANKVSNQAGLGIAGITCATSAIINVNYINVSSAAITPTAEINDVVEFRAGPLTTTASLSPANVPINTTTEQIFTIATSATAPNICLPGSLAIVNKPTNQAGLGYSPFARVVGINQVAIQFGVVTSGAVTTGVTPTAAETWSMAFLPQLNAYCPTVIYGIPAVNAATAASSCSEGTSAVKGVQVGDTVSGISRATTQVSTSVIGGYVGAVNQINVQYINPFASATPTSSEVYLATIQRQAPLNPLMLYSTTCAATTCAATTSVEATTTVTGLVVSTSVIVNKPTLTPGILVTGARVTAVNTLGISYMNLTTTSINVPAETYLIGNIQLQGPGLGNTTTAGLFVAQSYYPSMQQSATLAAGLMAALAAVDSVATVGQP